jgi:Domain of unknown function (DUF4326)
MAEYVRPGDERTRLLTATSVRPDLLALLPGLRGRWLGCWCVPEACHAEVIAALADSGAEQIAAGDRHPGGPA